MKSSLRVISTYIFIIHVYIMALHPTVTRVFYDRFVMSYTSVPKLDLGELPPLYRIFEFVSLFSVLTIWYPQFLVFTLAYILFVRLYAITDVWHVFFTHQLDLLKFTREEWKVRIVAGFPKYVELLISLLIIFVVFHFILTRPEPASTPTTETLNQSSPKVTPKESNVAQTVTETKTDKADAKDPQNTSKNAKKSAKKQK